MSVGRSTNSFQAGADSRTQCLHISLLRGFVGVLVSAGLRLRLSLRIARPHRKRDYALHGDGEGHHARDTAVTTKWRRLQCYRGRRHHYTSNAAGERRIALFTRPVRCCSQSKRGYLTNGYATPVRGKSVTCRKGPNQNWRSMTASGSETLERGSQRNGKS